ncbi:hypothetical protein GKJPGBOP_00131 [Streptomyces paromomycinus]|uniref:Uncharacterized protein n=1 Tax=Streptomyces paromomycinus TaxID=92743 RepID=A0A401VTV7_STREY|nr:hypothetical protein GKJPGBOP_00131 [Streptomyces paromomycinus]
MFQRAGERQWGTVVAAKAELNDLVTVRAEVKEHRAGRRLAAEYGCEAPGGKGGHTRPGATFVRTVTRP